MEQNINEVKWYLEARKHDKTMKVVTKDLLKHVKLAQKLEWDSESPPGYSHRMAQQIIRDKFWEVFNVFTTDRDDFSVKGFCDLSILKLVVSELDILNNVYMIGETNDN